MIGGEYVPQYISPNIMRICRICGKEFHPTARKQFCCNERRIINCAVCGKPFEIICNSEHIKETCSKECNTILIKQRQVAAASKELKTCAWCGKPFTPTSARDKYCKDTHFQKCAVCGKLFEIDVRRDKTVKTCSKECRYKLAKQNVDKSAMVTSLKSTMQSKYGVDNIMELSEALDKIKQSNQARYGVDWYTQTDEYKNRVKDISRLNYGADHFLSSTEVIAKRKATCIEKYGTDNVSKVPAIKDKIQATWRGKYGVDNISQVHIPDMQAWQAFKTDPRAYIQAHFDHSPTLTELALHLNVCLNSIYDYVNLSDNSDIITRCSSKLEDEVIHFIHEVNPNLYLQIHNRSIISPYELDIYIPSLNIAFECNPTSTHNSSICDPWGGKPKPNNYHKIKSKMCEDVGIRLIHIFGYEWNHKNEILKSIIRNTLQSNSSKIYGRKCKISEISDQVCRKFLSDNHRQGYSQCSIRIGLYHESELVSVMTFGKPRMSISKANDVEYELVRFCNKLNTTVIGGASKLFKYFIDNYLPNSIISYSDFARTSGKLYDMLGFECARLTEPGYVWVNTRNDIAYNRMHAQKQNIRRFLNDDTIDLTKTENDIMISHGYVKVCDSGNKVWIWSK